jgi:hypothetical protein
VGWRTRWRLISNGGRGGGGGGGRNLTTHFKRKLREVELPSKPMHSGMKHRSFELSKASWSNFSRSFVTEASWLCSSMSALPHRFRVYILLDALQATSWQPPMSEWDIVATVSRSSSITPAIPSCECVGSRV